MDAKQLIRRIRVLVVINAVVAFYGTIHMLRWLRYLEEMPPWRILLLFVAGVYVCSSLFALIACITLDCLNEDDKEPWD